MTTSMEAEAFLTVMKASVEPGVDDPQLLLARKTVETMKGTISGLSSWLLDPEPETRPRDPKFPSPKHSTLTPARNSCIMETGEVPNFLTCRKHQPHPASSPGRGGSFECIKPLMCGVPSQTEMKGMTPCSFRQL